MNPVLSPSRNQSEQSQQPSGGGGASQAERGGALHGDLRGATYDEAVQMLAPGGAQTTEQRGGAGAQAQERGGAGAGPAASVDESTPSQVRLENLSVSGRIPAGKTLQGSWQYSIRTMYATTVTISVSRNELRVTTSPTLDIDAQWPAQNMSIWSAGVNFGTGAPFANVHLIRGLGEGFIDMTDRARGSITGMLSGAIAGTAMARPGYDPFSDRDIMGTLARIKTNFENLPDAGGGGGDVTAADASVTALSATLRMQAPFAQMQDGVGVSIPSGAAITANAQGAANLPRLQGARSAGEAAQAATIQSLGLSSDGITLEKDGKPIARLESLTLHRGGQVTLDRFTLLGSGATAAGFESLIRLIAAAAGAAQHGAPPELGVGIAAQRGDLDPQFVRGLSKSMVEEGLTKAARDMVTQNRNAIPGVDLAAALGM
ncbi:MAG: hypothetical protein KC635_16045 [Myxococcales bacterium]|nr:hypothetical protein [Myxococcales bacterium]MCB9733242.1 hypothetical protein [Deltaproteobacteria bacterium]